MNKNITLVNYEKKYANIIRKIEEAQWGTWETNDFENELSENSYIKLIKVNETFAGIGYGKRIGSIFYIEVIVIKPEFQHQHLGSIFMEDFINHAKNLHLENLICEGVLINNHMNIENLMKKYNFKEILRIKEYWGYKYPQEYCKECHQKPCKCTSAIFKKVLTY